MGSAARQGFELPDDVVRKVRGDLWELRVTYGRDPFRILFYNPRGPNPD